MKIVLVRPVYQGNLGAAARAMKNFGLTDLALVNPKADKNGFTARLYAKHSEDVLKNARVYHSLTDAVKGFYAVGTTGVVKRFKMKKCVSVTSLPALGESTAIVFGNEKTGLSKGELAECDLVATIPTSSKHNVLNLSHAVAIFCSEVFQRGLGRAVLYGEATSKQRLVLKRMIAEALEGMDYVRDKDTVAKAFQNVLGRSKVSYDEAQALMAFLAGVKRVSSASRRRGSTRP